MFIYKITNIKNKKVYIGCSCNVEKRFIQHKSILRNNKHKNKYLQRSWNKYGSDNFTFEIIKTIKSGDKRTLYGWESRYIKMYKSNKRKFGFNISSGGEGTPGVRLSTKHKKIISQRMKDKSPYNLDMCKKDALQYKTRNEWLTNSRKAYTTACKKKWLEECCGHMKKKDKVRRYWTKELCHQQAMQFKNRGEWARGHGASYSAASRYAWLQECCAHMN